MKKLAAFAFLAIMPGGFTVAAGLLAHSAYRRWRARREIERELSQLAAEKKVVSSIWGRA